MLINPKDFKLAKVLLNHSLEIKPKEKILITCSDSSAFPLVKAVYIEALKLGAWPIVDLSEPTFKPGRSCIGGFAYQFYRLANEWQLNYIPKGIIEAKINWADAFINIVSLDNFAELAQIEPEKIILRSKLTRPYADRIIDSDRWVLTNYPTPAMAQQAGVSLDWLTDFYYRACLVDYQAMRKSLKRVERILDKGEKVRLLGKKTDLKFSIKGRLAKSCYGKRNIPDGEVYVCPIENSVEGKIYFDLPTLAFGQEVQRIYLEFKNGRVITAKADIGQEALEKELATDEGARRIGEFALGMNPNIRQALKNTLFDEKINNTIHLALGRAYKEKRGGGKNKSTIHWDLIKDMKSKDSKIIVDGKELGC